MSDTPSNDPADLVARLQAENARLRELLEVAQVFGRLGVWERDIATLEGRWDRQVFDFFGIETNDGHTPHFEEAASRIHPADRVNNQFHASLSQPGVHSCRYRVLHPDGSVRNIHSQWRVVAEEDGVPRRVVGVMVDDTESLAAASAARTAHTQLDLALSLAGIGTWRIDLQSRQIYHDARAIALTGQRQGPEGLPLETIRGWIHPDDMAQVEAAFDETLATGRPTDTQTRYLHAKGGWRTLLVRRALQRDAQGEPVALQGVVIDVTDQQDTQRRLREALQRARLAMSSVGMGTWEHDFASNSDDWDEQMFALRGLPPGPSALDEAARMALVHPDDRAHVAAQALALVASTGGLAYDFRVVHPDGSVHWLASRSTPVFDDSGALVRRIGVNWDITEAKVLEQAQRDREIALRESQAKSHFMARMSHELRTPLNAILGFSQLLLAADESADRGAQRQKLAKIHTAGQQLLSLVDGVLELSGLGGERAETQPAAVAVQAAPTTRPRVLYIEDNAVNMMIVSELLAQRTQYEFHGAIDGTSGVAMARTLQPALVLVDMQLPDFDGIEVLRRLRADPATAHLTCVALSANAMPDDVAIAQQAGFADYWTKPIDLAEFTAGVDRLVAARR
jgi:PAS domain S-box-containing protein